MRLSLKTQATLDNPYGGPPFDTARPRINWLAVAPTRGTAGIPAI